MGEVVRHVTDRERRARLGVRHALAAGTQVGSPEAATEAMTALHATEPPTPYLSCWARVDDFAPDDLDRALFRDRSLVKQLAMRRTLFVFPRELLPAVLPSASARVAATERARMVKGVVQTGVAQDGDAWIDGIRAEVLALLADAPEGLSARELRQAVPAVDVSIVVGSQTVTAPRVLTHLGASGEIMRGTPTGAFPRWRSGWTLTRHWLDDLTPSWEAADGYRELVRRWLRTFAPGTEDDIVWWLGSTKAVVRTALAELAAVQVSLDGGATGWLLPDDVDEAPDPGPWVALLPVLDPTIMGWRERGFYLGPHRESLFDRNGNAGTTVWADGRAVGTWTQDDAGVVAVRLLEKVSARTRRALDTEAERLTAWLGGIRIGTVYLTPAMKLRD